MNDIKAWAVNLCAILLVTAVINYLVPKGKVKKICETAFSLIILAVFCLPFFEMKNIDTSILNNEFDSLFSEKIDYALAYDESIKSAVMTILDENKIGYTRVEIKSRTENDEYILENVIVYLESAEDEQQATALLAEELKIDSGIILAGD